MTNTKRKPTYQEMEEAKRKFGFTNDAVFKYTLASNDETSNTILKTIASCILKREVLSVELQNTEPAKEKFLDKGIRLDVLVRCVDEKGKEQLIDLEIQNYGNLEYLSVRAQAYEARLISRQIKEKDEKYSINDIYVTMFVSKNYFEDERYFREYGLMDIASKEMLPENKMHIGFVELQKAGKEGEENVHSWELFEQIGYMMLYSHEEKKCDTIKMLVEEHEVLKMMEEKKESFFQELAEDYDAFKRMIQKHDEEHKEEIAFDHGIDVGTKIGTKKGIEIGKQQRDITNVVNMHQKGYPLEIICDCLNLSQEEVENIIKKQKVDK